MSRVVVPPYTRADGTHVDGYTYSTGEAGPGLAHTEGPPTPAQVRMLQAHTTVRDYRRRAKLGRLGTPELSRLRDLERALGPGDAPAGEGVRYPGANGPAHTPDELRARVLHRPEHPASPARTPRGNVRNLRAMHGRKLRDLARQMRGSEDREALEAVRAELRRREGESIDASLRSEDAYWRRVGGQSPVGSTGGDRRP